MGIFLSKKAKKILEKNPLWRKNSQNIEVAREIISEYVKRAKDEDVPISKEGIERFAKKHGFTDSRRDRAILEEIAKKGKVKSEKYD